MRRFCFLLFLCKELSSAIPADISFLLADVKYNKQQGAKICEVQQGNLSLFKGFDFIYHRKGVVGERLCQVLSQYNDNFWFLENALTFAPMKEHFIANKWNHAASLMDLFNNETFSQFHHKAAEDPYDISHYHAVVYARILAENNAEDLKQSFPGVLVMDSANMPYLFDKYKMSALFLGDERLERVKPKWKLYNKKYHPQLAEEIIRDMGSDLIVIKPKGSAEGKGVIILPKEQLDDTLKKMILDRKSMKSEDRGYKFWESDHSDSFLAEEYVPSDPVYAPHLGNKPYNGTMRVVFVLAYHKQQVHLHYLGAYWIIPEKSLEEEGTMHEKSKAYVLGTTYYCDVAKDTLEIVEEQLREPLKLMYQRMLGMIEASSPGQQAPLLSPRADGSQKG